MSVKSEIRATYAFVERNFNLVRRYINWEIVFVFYTIINTLTIGLIGVQAGQEAGETVLYLIVGALLWGFLSVLFHEVSESVSWERWEGTIEYTFMAPIHRLTHLGGMCIFAIIYGTIRTAIVLVAVTFFFDISLAGANLFSGLTVLAVSSLSFIGLGLMAAVLPLMSPEKGSQATHIIQGFILLVSGVYYEVEVLPVWLQPLSTISPATYTLRAARAALLEGATVRELGPELLMLAVIGLALIPIGLFIFSLGERYAMRAGKLKRNG
ncbi:MAG: ABC transporter permease [Firmicutes bacterium]|nr:ABC transporter permease [Bacillota bacterium]